MPRLLTAALATAVAGTAFPVRAGEQVSLQLDVAADESFVGNVRLEFSEDNGASYATARTADGGAEMSYTGTAGTPLTLAAVAEVTSVVAPVQRLYRVRVDNLAEDSDGITYKLRLRTVTLGALAQLPGSKEEIVTNGATAKSADLTLYHTEVTSDGSQGNQTLNVGNGAGAVIGQRKLITLKTRTHASDVLVLDHANIVNASAAALSAATIGTAGGFVFLEWNGSKWQVRFTANATLTAA